MNVELHVKVILILKFWAAIPVYGRFCQILFLSKVNGIPPKSHESILALVNP